MKEIDVHSYNVGNSDYAKHKIQPWFIWCKYALNPFTGDIIKRILRTKEEPGKTPTEARIMDYKKIKHICLEIIRQLDNGFYMYTCKVDLINATKETLSLMDFDIQDIVEDYNLNKSDSLIVYKVLSYDKPYKQVIQSIIDICDKRIEELQCIIQQSKNLI